MASFFTIGEQKIRPGLYYRYENWGNPPIAGVDDGRCAAVFASNWGPLGAPSVIENFADIASIYGDGGADGTTAVPMEQFKGGARAVVALRLGSGGTSGTYQIMDTTDPAPVEVIKLTLLHPGSKKFSITIRPTLADPDTTELLILDDATPLERFTFAASQEVSEADALISAVKAAGSKYFMLTKLADSDSPLAIVNQAEITPGTNPTIDAGVYSTAFEILEAYRWNVLAIDTSDPAIHMLMQMYIGRVFNGGKFVMGAIGEPSIGDDAVSFEARLTNASSYNDYKVVYIGNGFVDASGNVLDGWLAAARISGMIAGTPSNESITHLAITGAIDITERLTNYQHEEAIRAGMLTFSTSSAKTVWVDSGINTLVLPSKNEDEGWKKIKRTKVRFELFQRLNDTIEPLSGRINNTDDGRMTIIQLGNGVCNTMVAEEKLFAGAHIEIDPDNPPRGDSAWFLVYADDIDALEKTYTTFKFRFAPEESV